MFNSETVSFKLSNNNENSSISNNNNQSSDSNSGRITPSDEYNPDNLMNRDEKYYENFYRPNLDEFN